MLGCPRLLWEAVSQSLLLGFEDDFRHPAVRPPRHFRDSRWPGEGSVLYCLRPLFGWASHLARAVSQCFRVGCDKAFPSEQSGRAVSEAFPSQQALAFGSGDTTSVGPAGWSSGLARSVWRERGHVGRAVTLQLTWVRK